MHKHPPFRVVLVGFIALAAVAGAWWMNGGRLGGPAGELPGLLVASGTIEADETVVAAEIGGIVRELLVDEGDRVHAGDILVRLDDTLVAAQIAQAQAGVRVAQAAVDQAQAGARAEDRRVVSATLMQAIVLRDGAKQAWDNAAAIRANPQELNGRISLARADLELARRQRVQASAARDAAQAVKVQLETALATVQGGVDVDTPSGKTHIGAPSGALADLRAQVGVATNQWWSASESVEMAGAVVDSAERVLSKLLALAGDPIALDAQVAAARWAFEQASAGVDAASARLRLVEAGPAQEQLAVLRSQVQQAQATVGLLQAQLAKLTLRAALNGLVTSRTAHVGEMAAPGSALYTLAALDPVKLTLYISEAQVGRVRVGQAATVRVDSFSGESFRGEIVFVSSQAEFTPKNVQTQKERVNTVFAVRVALPNPELKLKPGMPADAIVQVE
jgi:HlyD family secretion protein